MANNSCNALLFFTSLFFLLVDCQKPLAPALYVFGDSLIDSGNNNFLPTLAKVNYRPYGIDFSSGKPTGRFTNGKTFVDFIAEHMGLPLVPAYLELCNADKMNITTGVNYASGAAGILPQTGTKTGNILSFDEQINYFSETVENYLSKIFKSRAELLEYLSKSIFMVGMGNNDYVNNYLQPALYPSSLMYNEREFADLIIDGLRKRLTRLYSLGARKFVVANLGRIGCIPRTIATTIPRPTTPCVEKVNHMVMLYNAMFPTMVTALERTLPKATFVRADLYKMNKNSSEAGFVEPPVSCCRVGLITGLCLPFSTPCPGRTTSIFWDAYHPTQAVNDAEASDCFYGQSSCVPINVQQLALKN